MEPEKIKEKAVILIVEDELLLRLAAATFVEDAGFEPVEAGNADEAIALLESRDDIRSVFTDIDMQFGSMNGLRLARAVRDRWPPIHIIVVSGHKVPTDQDLPSGARFYPKPYEEEKMIAVMREMLQTA